MSIHRNMALLAVPAFPLMIMGAAHADIALGMAEREPPSPVMWLYVIGVVALSWVMACRRWWLPLAIWVPSALFVSSLVADFADPVVGVAVRDELGLAYIFQTDLAGALILVVPLMFANIRFTRSDESDTTYRRRGR